MSVQVDTGDLLAVTILEQDDYKELINLSEEHKPHFFRAEDCARALFLSDVSCQPSLPTVWLTRQNVHIFKGRQAYETVLSIVSGLASKQKGESHSLSQFRTRLRDLNQSEEGRDLFKRLEGVTSHLLEDAKFLQSRVLDNAPKINYLRAARILSMKHPSDPVLILGTCDELVKAMAYTIGLTNTEKKPAKIFVCSDAQKALLDALFDGERFFGQVHRVDFATVCTQHFEGLSHVFCMTPLPPESLTPFLHSWRQRSCPETNLFIVPSHNKKEQKSFEQAFSFPESACTSSQEIIQFVEDEKRKRHDQLQRAQECVAKISYSRFRKERPLFKEMDKNSEEYQEAVEQEKARRERVRRSVELPQPESST